MYREPGTGIRRRSGVGGGAMDAWTITHSAEKRGHYSSLSQLLMVTSETGRSTSRIGVRVDLAQISARRDIPTPGQFKS